MPEKFADVSKHYASRSHQKMQEVLMHPDAPGPAIHYYMIRGGEEQKNITVWEPGTVGREYIKTYGHYHIGDLDETYWFLLGEGIALLQTLATDQKGLMIPEIVEDFKAVPVKSGDSIYIPSNCGHLVVNIGETYLVTADNSPVNFGEVNPSSLPGHADYELVKKMRGFAYYVVNHEGKPALVKNRLYQEIRHQELNDLLVID